ncbi:DUF5906 domain-containing protein [Brevifollis gellanilyticus]|uniref:DUF5906 domain-containing protein n=1 Tax=Brevifollis gellanilyticus TaxID=748831 RepID=UPI001479498B|nr:DUF5906 domain-containing protein [Brevifollis gellanilyticus]
MLRRYGRPFILNKGKYCLNVPCVAHLFGRKAKLYWEPLESQFYHVANTSFILETATIEAVITLLRDFVAALAAREKVSLASLNLTDSAIRAILSVVKSASTFPSYPHQNLFPVANGVIRFGVRKVRLLKSRVEHGFTHQCPVKYNSEAKCPKFQKFLEEVLPNSDDRRVLKLYLGGAFTGLNPTRRILLIRGLGGSGKTTLMRLQESLLGRRFTGDLRIDSLSSRFEKSFFMSARQLSAKDVPADSLQRRSAKALKHLSGGDVTQAEQKFKGKVDIHGSFFIVITSNGELRVSCENDEGAWLDRLLILDFQKAQLCKRSANYADQLLATESEGILNFFIEGGQEFLREVAKHGTIRTNPDQVRRAFNLIVLASKSLDIFVALHVAKAPSEALSNDMIIRKYVEFCRCNDVTPASSHVVYARLPDLMLHIHDSTQSTRMNEGGGSNKAYADVTFIDV